MQTLTIVLIVLFVFAAVNAVLLWIFFKKFAAKNQDDNSLIMLQNQLNNLSQSMDKKMGDTTKQMHESVRSQFQESQKLMRDINDQVSKQMNEMTKGVTKTHEASKQIFDIADQLQNLEQVLKHQKQRGSLGEASLDLILSNILPPTGYKLQYQFSDGYADAVIMTKDGLIPVDAKFSLDNYNRLVNEKDEEQKAALEKDFINDLKKRINETAKYIKPKEGTLPFAFMFIPAEGIYYDLLINEIGGIKVTSRSLIDYAYKDKNVIIVSPTTFAAYLQSVLYGFRNFQIEESAKEIQKNVEKLDRHLKTYDEYFNKLGNSLSTTVNHYNNAAKEFGKVDKDIYRITGAPSELESTSNSLDKPSKQEE